MLALIAGVTFTSCEDKLNIEQKGVISENDYYRNDEDCEKVLAAAYENFMINTLGRTTLDGGPGIYTPAKVLANHPGDDVLYASGDYGDHEFGGAIDEFRYLSNPEAINFHYRGLYLSVYKDNLVITHFAEGTTPYQKQAVAEARVLRAYNFFLLSSYWGQPPFVDHLLPADAIPENSEMTQTEYFEWVAKECEAAAADLSERASTEDKVGSYRVTKGFAYALAGKAWMFAGNYEAAKADLKKVIDSGKYALVSGDQFLDLFHVEGDGCPEKIFEINMRYNPAAGDWSSGSGLGYMQHSTWMEANAFNWRGGHFVANPSGNYEGGLDGWGSIGIPEWYGDAFHQNDGDSKRFKATLMHIDDAIYQTSGVPGMAYLPVKKEGNTKAEAEEAMKDFEDLKKYWVYSEDGGKSVITLDLNAVPVADLSKSKSVGINNLVVGLYGESFYLPFKILMRANDTNDAGVHGGNLRLNNIIVMRYAEVLLNYAECCLRTNDAGTAKTYVNMIQQRAGSKTISDNVDLTTLKKEKSFELWFEGCRYQDILRWSKTDNDAYDQECIARLKKSGSAVPQLYDKLFRAPKAEDENVVWEHGTEANSRFYIAHTHKAKDAGIEVGWQDKHRLYPYPETIMMQNPNLKQNTGWE